jgi:hypothetical protein
MTVHLTDLAASLAASFPAICRMGRLPGVVISGHPTMSSGAAMVARGPSVATMIMHVAATGSAKSPRGRADAGLMQDCLVSGAPKPGPTHPA